MMASVASSEYVIPFIVVWCMEDGLPNPFMIREPSRHGPVLVPNTTSLRDESSDILVPDTVTTGLLAARVRLPMTNSDASFAVYSELPKTITGKLAIWVGEGPTENVTPSATIVVGIKKPLVLDIVTALWPICNVPPIYDTVLSPMVTDGAPADIIWSPTYTAGSVDAPVWLSCGMFPGSPEPRWGPLVGKLGAICGFPPSVSGSWSGTPDWSPLWDCETSGWLPSTTPVGLRESAELERSDSATEVESASE